MVVRNTLRCSSCGSKIITRTQIGHRDRQDHSFLCPKCGISISYTLDLDQKKASWSFRDPKNAKWVKSEKGAITTLAFSDEIPVPENLEVFSPFIATFHNFGDRFEEYRKDEGLRVAFVKDLFDYGERCMVHFERENWKLFDRESPPVAGEELTPRIRLIHLYNFITAGFSKFTLNRRAEHERIFQRLTLARTIAPDLFSELSERYLDTGRIRKLWIEIRAVRRSFIESYNHVQPLFQLYYWRKESQDLSAFSLSDKRFGVLRQLYVDCFETLCRLLVVAIGIEAIIHHKALEIPTNKGRVTLDEYERLKNANKIDHLKRYPIEDLFVPCLDSDFRNGIGHNSAHYVQDRDAIVLYDIKNPGTPKKAVGYTAFCDKMIRQVSAFELAAMYHHQLHIYLGGAFSRSRVRSSRK